MKRIIILLIFSVFVFGCNKNLKDIEISRNEIIFWRYNESLTFEMLNNNFEEIQMVFEPYIIIPLNIFDYYLWDEQIFSMKYDIFENNYKNKFHELFNESDKGSIFFSIIVNNKVVFNGLNRIIPAGAERRAYDGLGIPIFDSQITEGKENVHFAISYVPSFLRSIHDHKYYELDSLFVNELYEYFISIDKIIRGRFKIDKLYFNVLEEGTTKYFSF
ncbi:MAG: hypothetical protein LBI28_14230 [Treponema sp.]|jgi:hypothetical protein|nr:hypothetical protein [Treponema sp.]